MPTDINTISAWATLVLAIVTIPTLLFIAASFTLQAKATDLQAKATLEQSKVTKLEFDRATMEKKPIFFARKLSDEKIQNSNYTIYKYEVELLRNDICSFKAHIEYSQEFEKLYPQKIAQLYPPISLGLIEGTILPLKYKIDDSVSEKYYRERHSESPPVSITIRIEFSDKIKVNYEQILGIVHEMPPISLPPVIKEKA